MVVVVVVVVKANCSRTGLRKYEKGKQTKKEKIIPKDLRWRKRGDISMMSRMTRKKRGGKKREKVRNTG